MSKNSEYVNLKQQIEAMKKNYSNFEINLKKDIKEMIEETIYLFIFIFIFTHNQLEINQSACRNKDCE